MSKVVSSITNSDQHTVNNADQQPAASGAQLPVVIRHLNLREFEPVWHAMRSFTQQRDADSIDEIWFVSHLPIYTQGQAGKAEHILDSADIPVIQIDRGGQVTYHGPGQLIVYLLLDLKRMKLGVRDLVDSIEISIVRVLSQLGIIAAPQRKAPGVYVNNAKIAALGLRIKRGCCYHGLSLNVDMDLAPFSNINPCGYAGLAVTHIAEHIQNPSAQKGALMDKVTMLMEEALLSRLAYAVPTISNKLPTW